MKRLHVKRIVPTLFAVAGLAGPAFAGPVGLLAGETMSVVAGADPTTGFKCYAARGFATFQRNTNVAPAPGGRAVFSTQELFDYNWDLGGQAVLTFTSATAGTIRFKMSPTVPAAIRTASFANYVETVDTPNQRVTVVFNILFPASGGLPACTLAVTSVFDFTS